MRTLQSIPKQPNALKAVQRVTIQSKAGLLGENVDLDIWAETERPPLLTTYWTPVIPCPCYIAEPVVHWCILVNSGSTMTPMPLSHMVQVLHLAACVMLIAGPWLVLIFPTISPMPWPDSDTRRPSLKTASLSLFIRFLELSLLCLFGSSGVQILWAMGTSRFNLFNSFLPSNSLAKCISEWKTWRIVMCSCWGAGLPTVGRGRWVSPYKAPTLHTAHTTLTHCTLLIHKVTHTAQLQPTADSVNSMQCTLPNTHCYTLHQSIHPVRLSA